MSLKTTSRYFLRLIATSLIATGCSTTSNPEINAVDSIRPSTYTTNAAQSDTVTTSIDTAITSSTSSPSRSSGQTNSTIQTNDVTTPSQSVSPQVTNQSPQVSITTIPLFVGFICSIQVNDTTQEATPNSRVIRIDLSTDLQKNFSVPVEVRTNNVVKRLLIQVQKSGMGYSQVVVPNNGISYVSAYASPDFIPESKMCNSRG